MTFSSQVSTNSGRSAYANERCHWTQSIRRLSAGSEWREAASVETRIGETCGVGECLGIREDHGGDLSESGKAQVIQNFEGEMDEWYMQWVERGR